MPLLVPPVHLIVAIVVFVFLFAGRSSALSRSKPGCQSKCGDVNITYPFGIGSGCYLNPRFEITCNASSNSQYPLLLGRILVSEISLDYVIITQNISRFCYTNDTDESLATSLSVAPFSISHTRNKFVAMGSDIFAFITQSPSKSYVTGCASLEGETLGYCKGSDRTCSVTASTLNASQPSLPRTRWSCNGIYCCETAFPYNLTTFDMQLNIMRAVNRLETSEREVCGYAFIAEKSFPALYRITSVSGEIDPRQEAVPAVLDWTVRDISCHEAQRRADYACRNNSRCFDTESMGYKCECLRGYKGNPYLPHGCQDVNECKHKICHENADCNNTPGHFSCNCRQGYQGDGKRNGTGCIPVEGKLPVPLIICLGLGIAIGLSVIIATALWLYKRLEKRQKDLLKRKFFDENGGRLLRHMMALSRGSVDKMKIYTIEELEKATDNFNLCRIIGKGGFGTVYKGMLQDGSIVAVKKSDKIDEVQVQQFVNEVFILTQIEHDHIVKLLGCCLETEVPLLVYEHVSNGTLAYHLHAKGNSSTLSWEIRLRIASEIADALDYLHSYGSAAIFHRDIKSSNVLLDENLKAIVADFGISRSVSVKKTHLTASVMQGTYGYMDPEYFHTWQFTSKCDVYAFGVLLAELVTGEKAICMDRNIQGLASYFTSAMKNGDPVEIGDRNLVVNEDQKEEIIGVARIAEVCLETTGDKRPTMKEVARQLQKLRKIVPEHPLAE